VGIPEYTVVDDTLIFNLNLITHSKLKKWTLRLLGILILFNNFFYFIDFGHYDQFGGIRFLPLSIIIKRIAVAFLISAILIYFITTLFRYLYNKSGKKTPYMILESIELATFISFMIYFFGGGILELLGITEFFIRIFSYQNFLSYYNGFGTSVVANVIIILIFGIYEAKRKGKHLISIKKTQIEITQQANYFFRKLQLDQIFLPKGQEMFQIGIKQDVWRWKFRTQYIFKSRYLTLEEFHNYRREPNEKNRNWARYSVIIMDEEIDIHSMIPQSDNNGYPIFGSNLGSKPNKKEVIELLELIQEFISIEIVQPLKHDITHKAPGVLKYFENENRI
jgi:hypothetical protein